MNILITVDPEIPVPPLQYGGIERIVDMIINGLVEKGHKVTLIANSASKPNCDLIAWKSVSSRGIVNNIKNSFVLTNTFIKGFDIVHSFSRLAYLTPLLPFSVPKIMSYQREPSLRQIKKAIIISKNKSLIFTGCSNYITNQIKTLAPAFTVYNGVDISKYTFNQNVDVDAPLIFLGRIEFIKGTHIAIEIAKKTNKQLIIAGNIPNELKHKEYFNNEIRPHLNDQIKYIGPVNDKEKNDLLKNSYAFLMPILWNEPFGIVMAEALACGTPVIGFNRGSVPEIVQNGLNGFICDNLNEAINAVKEISNISRSNCRAIAENKFSQSVIVNNYLELYENHRYKSLNYD